MSKGSAPRPIENLNQFWDNYDRIFDKSRAEPPEELPSQKKKELWSDTTPEYVAIDMTDPSDALLNLYEDIRCLKEENAAMRRSLDNIKVRSYELGQRELHDMALAALLEVE